MVDKSTNRRSCNLTIKVNNPIENLEANSLTNYRGLGLNRRTFLNSNCFYGKLTLNKVGFHNVCITRNLNFKEIYQSDSSSSSSKCDKEMVFDDFLTFDFSEVLLESSDFTTVLGLDFWPTTHSGIILLCPS